MRILVTGAAGFIGSHLSEKLIELGHDVIGVDCFTDYYSKDIKRNNIASLIKNERFQFIEADLLKLDLRKLISGIDYIYHQAAQAGVRPSWGKSFEVYNRLNILITQRLLEAAAKTNIKRLIFASSSSVYGDTPDIPMTEHSLLYPLSPYGVTKLAAEQLCYLYWKNFQVPVVSLRYFTVYGPRQRPDMAFNRFIRATILGEKIEIYGDGEQTRDFTYIADAVSANMLCMENGSPGNVYNIGGGSRITVNKVIEKIENISGSKLEVSYQEVQKGDMRHTYADISKAKDELGYAPSIGIDEGLANEVNWLNEINKKGLLCR